MLRRGLILIAIVVTAVLSHARPAMAANTARLVYLRGHATESCPDEQALRDAVAARLGYDPFTPWALDTLFAELEHEGSSFIARVKLVTPENVVRGARTLNTNGAPCADLIPTLGLTISLAIDPMAFQRKGPPEGLPPGERPVEPIQNDGSGEAPPQTPPPAEDPKPIPTPKPRILFEAGSGLLGTIASAPAPAIGVVLFGRLRRGDLSASIEGRADLPSSTEATGGGRVSSSIYGGSALFCAHTGSFFACPRGTIGVLSAEGLDVSRSGASNAFWAEVGGRLGYEFALAKSPQLMLRLHLDGGLILTRYTLRIDSQKVFEHPPIAGGLGIALATTFN